MQDKKALINPPYGRPAPTDILEHLEVVETKTDL